MGEGCAAMRSICEMIILLYSLVNRLISVVLFVAQGMNSKFLNISEVIRFS